MASTTRIFTNVGLVAMTALLFAGCSLLPAKVNNTMENKINVEDEAYTELSEDSSLDTIDEELDATLIEDEDLSDLEAELELGLDETMEK